MDLRFILIGSVLLGTITLAGSPRSGPATAKGCVSCRVPVGSGRAPTTSCPRTLLLTAPGPYEYIVTVGGRRTGSVSIFGDTIQGRSGRFTAPDSVPAAGLEEIVITDFADTFQATAHLTVMNAFPSSDVRTMGVTSPAPPVLPATNAYRSRVVAPPTDVRRAIRRTFDGRRFYEAPGLILRSDSDAPVKLYLRATNGTPLKAGKRCRKSLDGRPCDNLPDGRQSDPPSLIPIGAPAAVSSTVRISGASVPVRFFSLPVKRVVLRDVYRCVDGKLVFDHSEKCVRLGSVSWGFRPTVLSGTPVPGKAGRLAIQASLGMDAAGYIWAPKATCTKS